MATVGITLAFAGLLASGFAYAADGGAADAASKNAKASPSHVSHKASKAAAGSVNEAPVAPGPGRMQVEEPKTAAPVASARESKAWQKNHARGLTDAQKQAFRDRKEKMESMIAIIKEKRKAMASAKPEERAAIARELHTLILDKDPGTASVGSATARVADPASLEEKSSGGDAKKNEMSEARHKQNEWRQQSHKGHNGSGDNDDD